MSYFGKHKEAERVFECPMCGNKENLEIKTVRASFFSAASFAGYRHELEITCKCEHTWKELPNNN